MFDFTKVRAEIDPITKSEYLIVSNLYETSLPSTQNDNCQNWMIRHIDNAESIKMINFDEVKKWYCNKFICIDTCKASSNLIKSCDALYFCPNLSMFSHMLIEFKSTARDTFSDKIFCEEIAEKIFTSRSLLLHTFFEGESAEYIKRNVKMLIVYNYDHSLNKNLSSVQKLSNSISPKRKSKPSYKIEDKSKLANENINKMIINYKNEFKDFEIINAKDFQDKYVYYLNKYKCICC